MEYCTVYKKINILQYYRISMDSTVQYTRYINILQYYWKCMEYCTVYKIYINILQYSRNCMEYCTEYKIYKYSSILKKLYEVLYSVHDISIFFNILGTVWSTVQCTRKINIPQYYRFCMEYCTVYKKYIYIYSSIF